MLHGGRARMARRTGFDGTQQSEALRSLLKKEGSHLETTKDGRTLTELAYDLGISYVQLWRYLNGDLPLRSDQFAPFAAAFGTTEDALLRLCFPVLKPSQSRDWRAELIRLGASAEQAEAELARTSSLTPEQREGWLLARSTALAQGRPLPPPRARQPASQSRTG